MDNQQELDRLMRQPPTSHAESRSFREHIERERRETQRRLRAKRGVVVFSSEG